MFDGPFRYGIQYAGSIGIGLCRTEHMFFEEDRIAAFREMICSDTVEEREAALDKILPYQQGDFKALYEALEGNPVTIRFLDPPLHEFVPTDEDDIKKLADSQGKTVEEISFCSDLVSCKSCTWNLDHCSYMVLKIYTSSSDFSVSCLYYYRLNVFKLFDFTY